MTKHLVIAEKPSVASDIAKALGGFEKKSDSLGQWFESPTMVISSGIGHLVEIRCPKEHDPGSDLNRLPAMPPKFELAPIERTAAQLHLLGKLINRKDVDIVVNACDAGREGELIFRYIYDYVGNRKQMKRMWMQSMTPASIREAFAKMRPGTDFDRLADAAQCRSEADWLIGVNGTRAVTELHRRSSGTRDMETVGRVQTPTLAILVDREKAIRNFVPKSFFEIIGSFQVIEGAYSGKWINPDFVANKEDPDAKADRIFDCQKADQIVNACSGKTPSSVSEETSDVSNAPPKLFDLTTLQRECNVKYGLSAKQTLEIAQSLYEKHKALSYPRTDSSHLPEDYIGTTVGILGSLGKANLEFSKFASDAQGMVKPTKAIFNNAKISDHFALIPTGTLPGSLSIQEQRVFDLVCKRFIAAFFPPAQYKQTVRNTVVAGHTFRTPGRVLISSGWKQVYGTDASDKDDPPVVRVATNEIPENIGIKRTNGKTKAPSRFNEATLLAAMEGAGKQIDDDELREAMSGRGLGTSATRAAIIEKLLVDKNKKGDPIAPYVVREKKELVPQEKAEHLIDFLRSHSLAVLTSPSTTGEWEAALSKMEKGHIPKDVFMSGIRDMTQKIVMRVREQASTLPALERPNMQAQSFSGQCPKCQAALQANAKVISCTSCDFVLWKRMSERDISDTEAGELLRTGKTPVLKGFTSKKTGKTFDAALLLTDDGKVTFDFEKSVSASSATSPAHTVDSKCPSCGKGKLIGRQTKEGKAFIGCTAFPSCRHFEWVRKVA